MRGRKVFVFVQSVTGGNIFLKDIEKVRGGGHAVEYVAGFLGKEISGCGEGWTAKGGAYFRGGGTKTPYIEGASKRKTKLGRRPN